MNEVLQVVLKELRLYGINPEVRKTRKSRNLIRFNGHTLVVCCSQHDHRAIKKALCDVRRFLRHDGVI